MRKHYLLLIAITAISVTSFAQPILNSADMAAYYSSESYSADNFPTYFPGNPGTNQTWNFSALPGLTYDGTLSVVPIASTPHSATFPTANYAFKIVNSAGTYTIYDYYKNSTANFESVGSADNTFNHLETDHSLIFQFPYTYNTVINDTYMDQGNPTVYSFTSTYDGYGTLITPYDTYTNVIRQKRVETDSDGTYTNYVWFTTNPFTYLMSGSIVTGTYAANYVSVYKNFTNLSVNENKKELNIVIYPNPVSSILNVTLANNENIEKVIVTDSSGKIIIQQTTNTDQITVENLPSGIYLIEVYSGKEKFQSKFIKK